MIDKRQEHGKNGEKFSHPHSSKPLSIGYINGILSIGGGMHGANNKDTNDDFYRVKTMNAWGSR
jgi:hypothetical protein